MHNGKGRPETGWISRGNAKSAGTHDMPIPGMITSRRQPRPKKKAVPERQEPVISVKALKAAAAAERARVHRKKEKDERRERKKEREREESPERRSRSRRRKDSPSSSSSDDAGGGGAGESASVREKEARQERREKAMEEEEEHLRKETDERFRAAQEEREARQREEARLAEEKKKKDEQRHQDRKKKLKGAFATGDSDEEDEDAKRQRELAERFKKQRRSEALSAAAVSTVALARPPELSSVFLSGSAGSALSSGLASLETGPTAGTVDAVSIRAQLADPSASRNFTPGEVADKYKLLQEMKRKFRRSEFGGGVSEPKDKARDWRSRSRDNKRGKRSPSKDRSRYDSVWIKPGAR